ncbi:MAG: hypothetical protein ABUJ93_11025 [Hyphomicrobium sp.]|jgi:hypothetical protein
MPKPYLVYDPDNWEVTYDWDDRDRFVADQFDGMNPGEVRRCATLVEGPVKFAARVILTRDDDGDPNETEIQWFDTEEAARAAASK